MKIDWPIGKVLLLILLIAVYIGAGATFLVLFEDGTLPAPVDPRPTTVAEPEPVDASSGLAAAVAYVETEIVREEGHVDLYVGVAPNSTQDDNRTNSEAVSYRLYWLAREDSKEAFDEQLAFIQEHMLHPEFGYMMWRLEDDASVVGDGENIASDADLRTIKALLIAEQRWGDPEYTRMITTLSQGLEAVAITEDNYLAPYGGVAGRNDTWTAREVYLSYADFPVFNELAQRRGAPWDEVEANMKQAYLEGQIEVGLFNSYLSPNRRFGRGQDGEGYSINNLWMMVRAAESNDPQLRAAATEALRFYEDRYEAVGQLFPMYSSEGYAMSPHETPWAYALVGRAAVALGEEEVAEDMIRELLDMQVRDPSSPLYGAFPEGSGQELRVGQFTMQESIITMQDFLELQGEDIR